MNTTKPTYLLLTHTKAFLLVLLVFSFALSACGTLSTQTMQPPTQTPKENLPDLTITNISLVMQATGNGTCVDAYGPYEVRAVILNQGSAPATSIVVERTPGAQALIESLAPGQREAVQFPAIAQDGQYKIIVDPQNLIAESDENNNTLSFLAPTPTPPPLCPTPTP